jgi:hypothetical protein
MNPMMNQMAGLAGLAGLSGMLTDVVKAPLARWNQSSTGHKVFAAVAGAGVAYYLHRKGMADVAVAATGVATAYATSMLLHYPAIARGGVVQNGAAPPALPGANVNAMNQQAQAMMNNGGAPAMSGIAAPGRAPGSAAPIPPASSQWSILDAEM